MKSGIEWQRHGLDYPLEELMVTPATDRDSGICEEPLLS